MGVATSQSVCSQACERHLEDLLGQIPIARNGPDGAVVTDAPSRTVVYRNGRWAPLDPWAEEPPDPHEPYVKEHHIVFKNGIWEAAKSEAEAPRNLDTLWETEEGEVEATPRLDTFRSAHDEEMRPAEQQVSATTPPTHPETQEEESLELLLSDYALIRKRSMELVQSAPPSPPRNESPTLLKEETGSPPHSARLLAEAYVTPRSPSGEMKALISPRSEPKSKPRVQWVIRFKDAGKKPAVSSGSSPSAITEMVAGVATLAMAAIAAAEAMTGAASAPDPPNNEIPSDSPAVEPPERKSEADVVDALDPSCNAQADTTEGEVFLRFLSGEDLGPRSLPSEESPAPAASQLQESRAPSENLETPAPPPVVESSSEPAELLCNKEEGVEPPEIGSTASSKRERTRWTTVLPDEGPDTPAPFENVDAARTEAEPSAREDSPAPVEPADSVRNDQSEPVQPEELEPADAARNVQAEQSAAEECPAPLEPADAVAVRDDQEEPAQPEELGYALLPGDPSSPAHSVDRAVGKFELMVREDVKVFGFWPSGFPPARMYIESVQPDSWAATEGLVPQLDELVAVQGRSVASMARKELVKSMRARPLHLTFEHHEKPWEQEFDAPAPLRESPSTSEVPESPATSPAAGVGKLDLSNLQAAAVDEAPLDEAASLNVLFITDSNQERSITFSRSRLGMSLKGVKGGHCKVDRVVEGSHVYELGVQAGWRVEQIDGRDVTNMSVPTEAIHDFMAKNSPRSPRNSPRQSPTLKMEFKVHGEMHNLVFLNAPLGMDLDSEIPFTVKSVEPSSYAYACGLRPGWEITKVADEDVTGLEWTSVCIRIAEKAGNLPQVSGVGGEHPCG